MFFIVSFIKEAVLVFFKKIESCFDFFLNFSDAQLRKFAVLSLFLLECFLYIVSSINFTKHLGS